MRRLVDWLASWLRPLPLLGDRAAHPKVWSVARQMREGSCRYVPDPRWAPEAIAAADREVLARRDRADAVESKRIRPRVAKMRRRSA